MKKSEQPVYDYLRSLGLGPVVYEPDGNIPPDFLVDGRIAVETRLLNYNHFGKDGGHGLSETSIPLERLVRKVLNDVGAPPEFGGPCWFVGYQFWRPNPKKNDVVHALRDHLSAFLRGQRSGANRRILSNFEVVIHPASKSHRAMFLPGGYFDRDAGGFVIPTLKLNVKHCSDEKRDKVANFRHRYFVWWLILADRINSGFDEGIVVNHDWDKLIVIGSDDPTRSYEIYSG